LHLEIISENFRKNLKWLGGNWFTKNTWIRKSRGSVPLKVYKILFFKDGKVKKGSQEKPIWQNLWGPKPIGDSTYQVRNLSADNTCLGENLSRKNLSADQSYRQRKYRHHPVCIFLYMDLDHVWPDLT
jgi:hypothetical protein